MTEKEFLALAPREQDALVAEKVMGWRRMSCRGYYGIDRPGPTDWWHTESGEVTHRRAEDGDDFYYPEPSWSPTTDISAAWEVVEKLATTSKVKVETHTGWYVEVWYAPNGRMAATTATTAPLAICIAALKAVGEIE